MGDSSRSSIHGDHVEKEEETRNEAINEPCIDSPLDAPLDSRIRVREELRAEVRALIEPHQSMDQKPPFNALELITLALVLGQGLDSTMNKADILCQILVTFPYYGALSARAQAEYLRDMHCGPWRRDPMEAPIEGFWEAFKEYNLPVTAISLHHYFADDQADAKISIAASEARFALRNRLEPERTGAFDFFELPSELRVRIYEYALCFGDEESGLMYRSRREHPNPVPESFQRINQTAAPSEAVKKWWEPLFMNTEMVILPPMKDVLALLRVCRQTYKEAMPVFYGMNTFTFWQVEALSRWASQMPSYRLACLQKINIRLVFDDPAERFAAFPKAMQALVGVKKLARLSIDLYSPYADSWLDFESHTREEETEKQLKFIRDMPGMQELGILLSKAEEVDLINRDANFRTKLLTAYINEEIKRVKSLTAAGLPIHGCWKIVPANGSTAVQRYSRRLAGEHA